MNPTPKQDIDIFACGSVQMEVHSEPIAAEGTGAKRPARMTLRAGGAPVNIARALRHDGYRIAAFGVQHPSLHRWLADELLKIGASPLIRSRAELGASIMLPDGDGGSQVLTQGTTICREDFDDSICDIIRGAHLAIAGPMQVAGDGIFPILRLIARLARNSVLIPHLTLVAHERFGEVARLFSCVILNAHEAAVLSPDHPEAEFAALRLRHLTSGRVELLVTNGSGHGCMWADGNWRKIVPHKIGPCRDDGAGDTFAGYYAEGRFLRGLDADIALERALAGVALYLKERNNGGNGTAELGQPQMRPSGDRSPAGVVNGHSLSEREAARLSMAA